MAAILALSSTSTTYSGFQRESLVDVCSRSITDEAFAWRVQFANEIRWKKCHPDELRCSIWCWEYAPFLRGLFFAGHYHCIGTIGHLPTSWIQKKERKKNYGFVLFLLAQVAYCLRFLWYDFSCLAYRWVDYNYMTL